MTPEHEKLTQDIEELKSKVQRLRDEVRVRMHLGAMEARDAYHDIEREIARIGSAISDTTRHAWQRVLARLEGLATTAHDDTQPPSA